MLGFYYLINVSLYELIYIGSDEIVRDFCFNGNYIFNVILGKEWNW